MTWCNVQGVSPFQAFIGRWSRVQVDSKRYFRLYYERWSHEEVSVAPEFEGIRPRIGMTMLILKHTKADTETLARRDSVHSQGDDLLSLALRTADEGGSSNKFSSMIATLTEESQYPIWNPSAEYASRGAMLWIDRGHRPKEDPACTPLQLGSVTE